MTTGAPAVFFLGTRAHYQVLQQPESHFDVENGNTETIYQNPSWKNGCVDTREFNGFSRYTNGGIAREGGCYSVLNDANDEKENGMIKGNKRRSSETTLCGDDMKPSQLNRVGNDNASPKQKKRSLLTFLSSLARRKKRLATDLQYLRHLESVLTTCTYRESCRCLDCQSRYFECDDDEDDYSSDDSEYTMYVTQMARARRDDPPDDHDHDDDDHDHDDDDDDDEVFIDKIPEDNTSSDLLLAPPPAGEEPLRLEVAAGTPVLLNYLLTHPITCAIQ